MKYRRTLATVASAGLLALAACSSSGSSSAGSLVTRSASASASAVSGPETVTAIDTGKAAADNLNSSSNAPLTFPQADWAGPVATTVKPFTLPGSGNSGNAAATVTFVTPAGHVTVHHSANQVPGSSNQNTPPPATWTKAGTTCYFVTTFSKGTATFLSGTGKFKGAVSTGTGSFLVTARGYAPLKSGQTKCSFTTITNVQDNGAETEFLASLPLKVKV